MSKETFMDKDEHFERLVKTLPAEQFNLYLSMRHTRIEEAFRGRTFYIYRVEQGNAVVFEHLTVRDFECNDRVGASTKITSNTGREIVLSEYAPQQLWNYPVFMFIPLPTRVRWSAPAKAIHNGSLSFPLCIRTMSRRNLREEGYTYCETGVAYSQEFEAALQN